MRHSAPILESAIGQLGPLDFRGFIDLAEKVVLVRLADEVGDVKRLARYAFHPKIG